MRVQARPRDLENLPLLPVYALVSLFSIGAAFAVTRLPLADSPILCPLLAFSGIPCPTCGATRALAALATGDLPAALALNPLIAVTAGLLLLAGSVSAFRRLDRRPAYRWVLDPREKHLLRHLIIILCAANWIYLIFSL